MCFVKIEVKSPEKMGKQAINTSNKAQTILKTSAWGKWEKAGRKVEKMNKK